MSKRKPAPAATAGPKRGRPPSQATRRRALAAARALLREGGPSAVTMEGVATRARVGKPTLYRNWANRHELAMAALMETAEAPAPSGHRSPFMALEAQLLAMCELFTTPMGRNAASMLASADPSSEIARAFRSHFLQARRSEGRDLLAAAMEHGEVFGELDIDIALDTIYGPLFYRLLMGHAPLDPDFVRRLLAQLRTGWLAG